MGPLALQKRCKRRQWVQLIRPSPPVITGTQIPGRYPGRSLETPIAAEQFQWEVDGSPHTVTSASCNLFDGSGAAFRSEARVQLFFSDMIVHIVFMN